MEGRVKFSIEDVIHGLETDEFYIEFMPIVSLEKGKCLAAEALIRWKKGEIYISPMDFIPEFEESPLIGLLTYWIIEKIATELGEWLRRNREFHITINVPPELLGRGGLHYAGKVSGLEDLYPQIVLELTERGAPDKTAIEGIRFAHRLGLGIAVDDIDSTNLNLLLLARAKVDYIKLDKSVIDGIDEFGNPGRIFSEIGPIIALGRPLVVAEGIETDIQFQYLKNLGVQLGQGWLISKPLGKDEFFTFYEKSMQKDILQ
jgi:sensor c-di-GMP phosphodiesterase-like protein